MSDEEIPYESPAETADGHLAAAENWLVLAEGQRETLEAGTEPHDAADAVASGMQTGLLFSTAATLADLHRKMAETYWGYPRTLTSVGETPGPACYPPVDGWDGKSIVEQDPPCTCCAAGLFTGGDAPSLCADCGHVGDRHNGNAPKDDTSPTPPYAACSDFVFVQPASGRGPLPQDLCDRCGASTQAHIDRGLRHLAEVGAAANPDALEKLNDPALHALLKASIFAQNASKHRTAEWLRACADATRAGAEWPLAPRYKGPLQDLDALTDNMLGQVRDAAQAEMEERARRDAAGKPWRSPGGAGQWNG